ncbi:MAG: hypothetical protein LBU24_03980 [Methanocalculaceae archaeon]|jgi:hypothetical protein|nr:hypothetical protein [Methanocalculaceae archaeon]
MREVSFPVRSLGSAKPVSPTVTDLGEWVRLHKGQATDLITWEVEETLKPQVPAATIPAAGGVFYGDRITAAFSNVANGHISDEFDLRTEDILADCRAAGKIVRGCWWAVPAPQTLHLADAYFDDDDEAAEALADAMTRICRLMRDAGAAGHVLIYDDDPGSMDLEYFLGKRFLRYVPDAFLENVLEVQQDLILSAEAVPHIAELANSYTIRQVYVTDPDAKTLIEICRLFDPEEILLAGTAPEAEQQGYWEGLAELRIRVADV